MSSLNTYWWTKADGSYGSVRATSVDEARKKKKGAKIHTKPPYTWVGERKTSRKPATKKKPAAKKTAPRKTSRAPAKKSAPKKTSRKAPVKKAAPKKAAPKKTSRRGVPRRGPAKKRRWARRVGPTPEESRSETAIEAKAIAEAFRLLAKWKVPGYSVIFSSKPKYRRCMGTCNMRNRVITFSRLLWDRATEEQRNQTVNHEVAHAIVRDDYGIHIQPHGKEWKAQMKKMGFPKPRARHKVPVYGFSDREDVVVVACNDNCGARDISVKALLKAGAVVLPNSSKSLWTGLFCVKGDCQGPLMFFSEGDKNRFRRIVEAMSEAGLGLTPNVHACGGCH